MITLSFARFWKVVSTPIFLSCRLSPSTVSGTFANVHYQLSRPVSGKFDIDEERMHCHAYAVFLRLDYAGQARAAGSYLSHVFCAWLAGIASCEAETFENARHGLDSSALPAKGSASPIWFADRCGILIVPLGFVDFGRTLFL